MVSLTFGGKVHIPPGAAAIFMDDLQPPRILCAGDSVDLYIDRYAVTGKPAGKL